MEAAIRYGRVIDLTHRLLAGEEEYGLEIETHRVQDLYPQYHTVPEDHYVMTRIRLSPHIGTHIEAPSHLIRGGTDVSGLALDKFVGGPDHGFHPQARRRGNHPR